MVRFQKTFALASLVPMACHLASCAIVPNLEEEASFSYKDILNQIECEAYFAIEHINQTIPKEKGLPWTDLAHWSADISLNPQRYADEQVGINGSSKTVAKAGSYFQWTIGGTSAVPGGPSYESYGTASAKNDWVLNLQSLYATHPDPKDPTKKLFDMPPLPNGYRQPNKNLKCEKPPSVASTNQLPDSFSAGVFGIEDFLQRSVDAGENLGLEPKTIVFTKEFKKRIQVGVTPGWYVTAGNTSPAIGAYASIDDIIMLTFTPPPANPPAKPIPVYEVPNPNKPAVIAHGRPLVPGPTAAAPGGAATPRTARGVNRGLVPVNPAVSDTLTNGSTAAGILQKLNQLPQQ